MNLRNKYVWFHLSDNGREVPRGLIPDRTPFEALVMREDEIGAWIMLGTGSPPPDTPSVPVTLVKWGYIKSVTYEHLIGDAGSEVDESLLV